MSILKPTARRRFNTRDAEDPQRKSHTHPWAITEVRGNLVFTADRVVAWYLSDPVTWSFRAVADIESLIYNQASQLADLVGTTVHGRVTTRPYPVAHWGAAAWRNAADPQPGFDVMMERDQRHMAAHSQADKLVYYGVDLGSRSTVVKALASVSGSAAEREMGALEKLLGHVDQVMGRPGLAAQPAQGKDLEWLLARSFALGCPVPVPDPDEETRVTLDGDDLEEWVESVSWSAEPLTPTVQVTTSLNSRQVARHVVVLTVARIGDIQIPEKHDPWMAKSDALGFPVEWSFRVIPRTPEEVSKEMTGLANRIDGQVSHWADDHGKRPPKQLARQAGRAADVEDEMRSEFTGMSTRTKGWYRLAVSAHTEDEALDRAQRVIDHYRPQVKLVRQLGQYHLAREFIPGERLATLAHARKFPVTKVAAGLPNMTAEVGDKRGFHIAETASMANRAVLMDPWYLTEVMEQSGLIPIVGTPGAGKSVLMWLLTYKSILSGVRGVGMDPAGRGQRLLELPEIGGGEVDGRILPPLARSVDVLGGASGSLSPYAVVPEPNEPLLRLDCASEEEFRERLVQEKRRVQQTRRDLVTSTLRWCLPVGMHIEPVLRLLRGAVMKAPAYQTSSASTIISQLAGGDDDSKEIAQQLEAARERELGHLLFSSERGMAVPSVTTDDRIRFTMFNLKGLQTPTDDTPVEEWRPEELLARPIMTLASWSALQLIYRSDPNERKLFALDEAQEITQSSGGAGRTLTYKLSSDSRKNNCAALVSTQNASTVLGADINNFVGAAFVGRTQDAAAQKDALKLLGKPAGIGFEGLLNDLSPQSRRSEERLAFREFIYRDGLGGEGGHGGMEKIRVTLEHHPELRRVLDSTADPKKRIHQRTDSDGSGEVA